MNEKILKEWCIALTGGIATGKSTVAKYLRTLGHIVIDADYISRQAFQFNRLEIGWHFGSAVFDDNGVGIDRKKLRKIIADDYRERTWLEDRLANDMELEMGRCLEKLGMGCAPRLFFYEAALIHEKNVSDRYREVWCTYCPIEEQRARLMQRDSCTDAEADSMLAIQMPSWEKAQKSDLTLHTSNPLELYYKIDQALKDLACHVFKGK